MVWYFVGYWGVGILSGIFASLPYIRFLRGQAELPQLVWVDCAMILLTWSFLWPFLLIAPRVIKPRPKDGAGSSKSSDPKPDNVIVFKKRAS